MHETMLLLLLALVGDTAAVAGRFIPFARRHRMTKMMSTIRGKISKAQSSSYTTTVRDCTNKYNYCATDSSSQRHYDDGYGYETTATIPIRSLHTLAHTGANLYYFRRPTTRRHYLSLGLLLNLLVFVFIYDTPLRSVAQRNQNMLVVSIALLWLLHQHEN